MHDIPRMRVPQGIGNEPDHRQDVFEGRAGERADIRPRYVLQAVKRRVVIVELENARDVRVDKPNRKLPVLAKVIRGDGVAGENLQRDRRARNAVPGEPGLCRTAATKLANQRVAARQFQSAPEVQHRRSIAHPVGSGTLTGAADSSVSTNPVSAS